MGNSGERISEALHAKAPEQLILMMGKMSPKVNTIKEINKAIAYIPSPATKENKNQMMLMKINWFMFLLQLFF